VALFEIHISAEPQHRIFVYLVPTALVAIRFGSVAAMLASIASAVSAAYFLYPPKFSIYVANQLYIGELVSFFILASAASQIIAGLAKHARMQKQNLGNFTGP
jgi:K+-sensing histidine kinase KdpD